VSYTLSAKEIQFVREARESLDHLIDRLDSSAARPKDSRRK
jgi:hypothetical protein